MTSKPKTELVQLGTEQGKSRGSSFFKNARRAGIITVAAAFVAPLALPAFAANNELDGSANGSLQALVSEGAQHVEVEQTAGLPGIEALTIDATSQAELDEIRERIEAEEAAAEEAAAEEAAAEEAAAEEAASEEAAAAPATQGTAGAGGAAGSASTAPSQAVSGSAVANAAIAQLGQIQDCTSLVAGAIAAVGIPYTGMGGLFNLGPTISQGQAAPGDIIYYSNGGFGIAHIAIYIGNGQAVHGGWAGNQTVIAGVNIGGSAPVFIDIT